MTFRKKSAAVFFAASSLLTGLKSTELMLVDMSSAIIISIPDWLLSSKITPFCGLARAVIIKAKAEYFKTTSALQKKIFAEIFSFSKKMPLVKRIKAVARFLFLSKKNGIKNNSNNAKNSGLANLIILSRIPLFFQGLPTSRDGQLLIPRILPDQKYGNSL